MLLVFKLQGCVYVTGKVKPVCWCNTKLTNPQRIPAISKLFGTSELWSGSAYYRELWLFILSLTTVESEVNAILPLRHKRSQDSNKWGVGGGGGLIKDRAAKHP